MKIKKLILLPVPLLATIYSISIYTEFSSKDEKIQLIEAVKQGKGDVIRDLFLVYIINPNYVDATDHSPLYYAVTLGNIDAIEALLNNGADPNYPMKYKNDVVTALQLAYRCLEKQQMLSVLELLLKEGHADPNVTNNNGDTLLYFAARDNNIALIDLLVKYGANINVQNYNGNSPLHEAVHRKNKDAVRALVERGAYSTLPNNKGETPFSLANEEIKLMIQEVHK